MKQKQISELKHSPHRWPATTIQLGLIGLLSACGAGTPGEEPTFGAAKEEPIVGYSASAAQLSNDTNYSVGFAQAVAAGVEAAPVQSSSTAIALSSIESAGTSIIPTSDSANSAVVIAVDRYNATESDNIQSITDGSGNLSPTTAETSETDNIANGNTTDQVVTGVTDSDISATELEPTVIDSVPLPTVSGAELTDALLPTIEPLPPVSDTTPSTTSVEPEPSATPSTDNEITEIEETSSETLFYSSTSPGFNGEVLSDSVRVTWPVDPDARGYNVYRQAQFVTSVFTEEYIDEDVYDGDYYYEIQAFDNSDTLYYVATGLTVKPRTFGTTDPDAPTPNTQLLDGYDLVFSDEFTSSTLDSTKWNTSYLWGTDIIINSEEQYYVDILNEPDFGFNPFSFDGENLTINSIETPSELSDKSLNQPYLSGVITSYDAFKFTYGYVETRAKVTFGRGYWPAFWLLNAYYVDDMPEIDIMEFIGDNQDVVYHTYHYFDSDGNLRSTPSKPSPGIDYTLDFHTYAVEWKPGTIIFYINSVEVHRIVDPKVSQQEMYVIANTALGGWWAGSPDNTTPFPGQYVIDYIRVYQKSQPYDDNLLDDGFSQVPYADQIFGTSSPSHRPSQEEWPEGYPSGQ